MTILQVMILMCLISYQAVAKYNFYCEHSSGKYIEFNMFDNKVEFALSGKEKKVVGKKIQKEGERIYYDDEVRLFIATDKHFKKVYKVNYTLKSNKQLTSFRKCSKEKEVIKKKIKDDIPTILYSKNKFSIFNKTDELGLVKFIPQASPLSFEYDVIYYIPKRIKDLKNMQTVVFLHGGGGSTITRKKSINIINIYTPMLVRMARNLGVALIIPSATGLNWGRHTTTYLKELNALIRKDLPVDNNRIGLVGHSMGGMAITRVAPWLTDEFSFFLPISAGADSKDTDDKRLNTLLNTKYHHIQGNQDSFTVFLSRVKKQADLVKKREEALGKKLGFTHEILDGDHSLTESHSKLISERILELLEIKKRNLYQKEIYGLFMNQEGLYDQYFGGYTYPYYTGIRDRSFWIKATQIDRTKKALAVHAKVTDNQIKIEIDKGVKSLRVYLSQRMLNLQKPIRILVNGVEVFNKLATPKVDKKALDADPSYIFESFVDIKNIQQ